MIDIYETPLKGLLVINAMPIADERGAFRPVLSFRELQKAGLDIRINAISYSISQKNVIRGMHFQSPPAQYTKIIYISHGCIIDVAVDIRKKSATFGEYFAQEVTAENGKCLIIPPGFAHGFAAMEDETVMHYAQSAEWAPSHYFGIRYDSFGYDWGIASPILSERDRAHPALKDFVSPF